MKLIQELRTLEDKLKLEQLLAQSRSLRGIANVSFRASWLLEGGEGDALWKTRNGGKEKLINGNWNYTINASFDVIMPDGTNLLDPCNTIFLKAVQKWSFLCRQGLVGETIGPTAWQAKTCWAINFVRWLVLNDPDLNSRNMGLMLLTDDHIGKLLEDLARGNWVEALSIQSRLRDGLLELSGVDATNTPSEQFNLNEESVRKIYSAIEKNNGFTAKPGIGGQRLVSRTWLSKVFAIPEPLLRKTSSTSLFLRQFEPDLQHPHLYISRQTSRQFPSQNCPLLNEISNTPVAFSTYQNNFINLRSFLKHSPFLFENTSNFDNTLVDDLSKNFEHLTRNRRHHNLLPISTGLELLNKAFKWVLIYGPYLTEVSAAYTLALVKYKKSSQWSLDNNNTRGKKLDGVLFQACEKANRDFPSAHSELAITSRNRPFRLTGIDPSLKAAVQGLVGACAFIIAGLKPSRQTEIHNLNRNCITKGHFKDEKYCNSWIWHELGKSGVIGFNSNSSEPIPEICVKAIHTLQNLGDHFREIFDDKHESSGKLFYFPTGSGWEIPDSFSGTSTVDICLDKFCDLACSPLDKYGRRWYVRTHELRKLFLITLFWHAKHYNLESARFAAGHKDLYHTLDYIEATIPGDEISRIEAEYVDDRLIKLESKEIDSRENKGLCALYNDVCLKFNVSHIESVPEKLYFGYLKQLRASGTYNLKPILINTTDGTPDYEIAVKYGELNDNKYNQ